MSQFHLEGDEPRIQKEKEQRELRERMTTMVPYTSFRGKLDVATAPLPVLEALAHPVEMAFREYAATNGKLIAETFQDTAGRTVTRYHGPDNAAWKPFQAPGVRARIAPLTTIGGKTYITSKMPPEARRLAALNKAGFSE